MSFGRSGANSIFLDGNIPEGDFLGDHESTGPTGQEIAASVNAEPERQSGLAELKAHEIAGLFPLMDEGEYQELKADIKKHGLLEPIWLHPDGSIIDGRHRYRACVELDIEPKFRTWEDDAAASLTTFVVSLNMKRRHLTASQKAWVSQGVLNYLSEEAKKRMSDGGKKAAPGKPTEKGVGKFPHLSNEGKARDQAAKIVGVDGTMLDRAKKVAEKGAPELQDAVARGEITVSVAKELTVLPPEKQAEVVAKGKKEAIKIAKELKSSRKPQETERAEGDQIDDADSAIDEAVGRALKKKDDELLDQALKIVEALRNNRDDLMALKIKIESILIIF